MTQNLTDLAEFVSDYWAMYRENGGKKPTAREIADQYIEHEGMDPKSQVNRNAIISQVEYYLP